MGQSAKPFFDVGDFVPSLREAVEREPLDLTRMIRLGVRVEDSATEPLRMPASCDRTLLMLVTGESVCGWRTDSLRALFRGNQEPPVIGELPEVYANEFTILEFHTLEISTLFGDRRDEEMREIYSALRRRPDGRSLGFVHDYLWQAAALMLGTRPLSQAEFEAILARLEQSCRTFQMGPTSRNYVGVLKDTLGSGRSGRG